MIVWRTRLREFATLLPPLGLFLIAVPPAMKRVHKVSKYLNNISLLIWNLRGQYTDSIFRVEKLDFMDMWLTAKIHVSHKNEYDDLEDLTNTTVPPPLFCVVWVNRYASIIV